MSKSEKFDIRSWSCMEEKQEQGKEEEGRKENEGLFVWLSIESDFVRPHA